jgi:hypothetical protein
VTTPDLEERALRHMVEEPRTSTRMSAATVKVSQNTVVRMVYEQLLHPYHLQEVQGRTPSDDPRRLHSANGLFKNMQQMLIFNLTFCSSVKQDLHDMALSTSIILICEWMNPPPPTKLFCSSDINTDFLLMCG